MIKQNKTKQNKKTKTRLILRQSEVKPNYENYETFYKAVSQ